jgi:hypothetical protein
MLGKLNALRPSNSYLDGMVSDQALQNVGAYIGTLSLKNPSPLERTNSAICTSAWLSLRPLSFSLPPSQGPIPLSNITKRGF